MTETSSQLYPLLNDNDEIRTFFGAYYVDGEWLVDFTTELAQELNNVKTTEAFCIVYDREGVDYVSASQNIRIHEYVKTYDNRDSFEQTLAANTQFPSCKLNTIQRDEEISLGLSCKVKSA